MSDALPLPPRPDLEQYRKLAKDLQRACASGERRAIRAWAPTLGRDAVALQRLDRAPRAAAIDRRGARQRTAHGAAVARSARRTSVDARACSTDAQFFIAREHGFASWPKFARTSRRWHEPDSPVSMFEAAVDAIVAGDAATLAALLREHPELVRARSTREHRSTLLHYVSANGVEDFRQKTPPNIVEITTSLLEAGADVNAESEAYGGGSTRHWD